MPDPTTPGGGPGGTSPLAALLPAGVAYRESREPATWRESDLPEEQALTARAVPGRRLEFGAVRALARDALASLGFPPAPILHDASRSPIWPEGAVGSLTHCDGFCAAAVARRRDLGGIGIDAEVIGAVDETTVAGICDAGERAAILALERRSPGVAWRAVVFSAKESALKAAWLALDGAVSVRSVRVEPTADGRFTATAGLTERTLRLAGRWATDGRLVFSAAAFPPD